jgi:hypothetical protein
VVLIGKQPAAFLDFRADERLLALRWLTRQH